MPQLLSYRNWSLLVVLPSVGLLTIAINYPIWLGLLSIVNDLPSAECLRSIKGEINSSGFIKDNNIRYAIGVLISYFLGFIIQAINTTWWDIKSNFKKCLKVKAEFIGDPEYSAILKDRLKNGELHCTEQKLACCFIIRQFFVLRNYFDSVVQGRLTLSCKGAADKHHLQDVDGVPKAGESGYAAFQFYLEKEKTIASYLEWEKFLASFYEYLVVALALSGVAYVGYGALFFILKPTFDVWLFASYPLMLIMFCWVRHASSIHTRAKMRAEAEAWINYRLSNETPPLQPSAQTSRVQVEQDTITGDIAMAATERAPDALES